MSKKIQTFSRSFEKQKKITNSYLGRGGGVILNLLIGELGVVTTKSSSELQEFTEAFNAAAA